MSYRFRLDKNGKVIEEQKVIHEIVQRKKAAEAQTQQKRGAQKAMLNRRQFLRMLMPVKRK